MKIKTPEHGVIEFSLYNGSIHGRFLGPTEEKPSRHMYYVTDGKEKEWRPRSVSAIANVKDKSQFLIPWSQEESARHLIQCLEAGKKIDEEQIIKAVFASDTKRDEAADLGSKIHAWIEQHIGSKISKKNPSPEMPEDENILIGVNSFLEWESSHKVKYLWAEKLLYSKKYDYIGKADFGAIVDGKRCVLDIKTGNGLYDSVLAQTAAYLKADEEESDEKYNGRWAIRISKETEKEYLIRMALKNKIKTILGKSEKEVYPYKVFEAVYLDEDEDGLKKDFTSFLSGKELLESRSISSLYEKS